jgi:hypothetical protein
MKTIDRSSVNHSVAVMNLTIGASSLVGPHRSSKAEDGCHCVTGISQLRNCCLYLSPEGVSFFVSFFVSFPESLGIKISLLVVDSSHQKGKFIHQSTCSLSRFITCSRILAEIGLRFDYLQTPFGKEHQNSFLTLRISFLLNSRQRHCVVTLVDRRIAFSSLLPRASILDISFNNCLSGAHFAC